eukprot:604456-Amphidinium_carterae.1
MKRDKRWVARAARASVKFDSCAQECLSHYAGYDLPILNSLVYTTPISCATSSMSHVRTCQHEVRAMIDYEQVGLGCVQCFGPGMACLAGQSTIR